VASCLHRSVRTISVGFHSADACHDALRQQFEYLRSTPDKENGMENVLDWLGGVPDQLDETLVAHWQQLQSLLSIPPKCIS
jgi:hypothetical protein